MDFNMMSLQNIVFFTLCGVFGSPRQIHLSGCSELPHGKIFSKVLKMSHYRVDEFDTSEKMRGRLLIQRLTYIDVDIKPEKNWRTHISSNILHVKRLELLEFEL